MAYDEGLAERIRNIFREERDLTEKKMFGGLCFMFHGHMCCGIVGEKLMLRVGPDRYDNALSRPHVSKMDFTGRPMNGMIYVEPAGISEDEHLSQWIDLAKDFVLSLPPKK